MTRYTLPCLLGLTLCSASFADGTPNLTYTASTGNVELFSDGANVVQFTIGSDGAFLPPADFSEVDAAVGLASLTVDNLAEQIGWVSALATGGIGFGNSGDVSANLGDIFPTGLDLAGVESLLTENTWEGFPFGQGNGGAFDLIVETGGQDGDFNGDGVVDAADYATWRNGLDGGEYDQADYQEWRDNYGAGVASATAASANATPEPASLAVGMLAVCGFAASRRGRR